MGKPLVRFCEGQENNCRYGKDHVAPPRKQAENRENKYFPAALGGSCLLERSRVKNGMVFQKNTD